MRVGSFSRSSSTSRLSTDLQEPSPSPRTRLEEARIRFLTLEEKHLAPTTFYKQHGEFTLKDRDLWHLLEQFALHGGRVLDLSAHDFALERVPPEVMEAFGDICRDIEPPPQELLLPPLKKLPLWVNGLPLQRLGMHGFFGQRLDARSLPRLQHLDLGTVPTKRMTLRVPTQCVVGAVHADGRAAKFMSQGADGHRVLRLRPRGLNFNGRATFKGTKDDILCRHLSLAMLSAWKEFEWRPAVFDNLVSPLRWLGSFSAIQQNVSPESDALCQQLVERPKDAHFVAEEEWDRFVHWQFDRMRREGKTTGYAMVSTNNHAMAIKFDASTPGQELIECFDPNFTTELVRSRAPFEMDTLFHKSARVRAAYLGAEDQAFGPAPHLRVTMIENPFDLKGSIAAKRSQRSLTTGFARLPQHWHPAIVKELVEGGFVESLDSLPRWLDNADMTAEEFKAFVVSADAHGYSSLYLACEGGHAEVMPVLHDCLLVGARRKLLSEKDIVGILTAQTPLGRTALEAGFRDNHAETVKAFSTLVLDLAKKDLLSPKSVHQLMRAKTPTGLPQVVNIRSNKVACAYDTAIRKLYDADALTKDAYQDLREELKSAREDIALDKAKRKQGNKAAKAALI
ncbi:ShET2/EspL2 family type III secretion system effector toxin [Hydrogenophaga intermedia]|uniref:OspD3 n=1 Tax=Hydrogenophaga intermedia TaxID=65786 RepID=A0A1L1PU68_HYDIT|nr:ShET2/EspL2 family type III secretion system effector toxin [Hydrogenophaga intermedia]CDN88855.1 OspD3 [Hydrogenophaga intermedia]